MDLPGCSKVVNGDAVEPPWPSKALLETAPEPSMVPKKFVPEPREPIKGRPEHASQPLCPRKTSLAQQLRAWTAPRTLYRMCCRFHLCLLSSFLHVCFFANAIVFVLSLVLLPSLVFTVVLMMGVLRSRFSDPRRNKYSRSLVRLSLIHI